MRLSGVGILRFLPVSRHAAPKDSSDNPKKVSPRRSEPKSMGWEASAVCAAICSVSCCAGETKAAAGEARARKAAKSSGAIPS